jgi:myb proto-oncogene protein
MSNCPQATQKMKFRKKRSRSIKWTLEDDNLLTELATSFYDQPKKWNIIAKSFQNKTPAECRHRYRTIQPGIVKGPWTEDEDKLLISLVETHGRKWSIISEIMHSRSGKQVRERYLNNLDPNLNKKKFSQEEDAQIVKFHSKYGPLWSKISKHFPGRSVDIIKNRFYSVLKNRVSKDIYPLKNAKFKQESQEKENTTCNSYFANPNKLGSIKKSNSINSCDERIESFEDLVSLVRSLLHR